MERVGDVYTRSLVRLRRRQVRDDVGRSYRPSDWLLAILRSTASMSRNINYRTTIGLRQLLDRPRCDDTQAPLVMPALTCRPHQLGLVCGTAEV